MHKQAKAESPALSSALQPGTLSTVSLNCDSEVKMGPGVTPPPDHPLVTCLTGMWRCLLCAWTISGGAQVSKQARPRPSLWSR